MYLKHLVQGLLQSSCQKYILIKLIYERKVNIIQDGQCLDWTVGCWTLGTWCAVLSHSVVSDLIAHQAPLSMGILQARILEWVAMPSSLGNVPDSGIQPRSPTLQVDFLPSELPWKPFFLIGPKHHTTRSYNTI